MLPIDYEKGCRDVLSFGSLDIGDVFRLEEGSQVQIKLNNRLDGNCFNVCINMTDTCDSDWDVVKLKAKLVVEKC
jgi:hypothetical protein